MVAEEQEAEYKVDQVDAAAQQKEEGGEVKTEPDVAAASKNESSRAVKVVIFLVPLVIGVIAALVKIPVDRVGDCGTCVPICWREGFDSERGLLEFTVDGGAKTDWKAELSGDTCTARSGARTGDGVVSGTITRGCEYAHYAGWSLFVWDHGTNHPSTRLRFAVLGGGIGMQSTLLARRFPGSKVEVVDVDENAIRMAKEWFCASEEATYHAQDAHAFIKNSDEDVYDGIFIDVFSEECTEDSCVIPKQFRTEDWLKLVKRALKPGGMVVANLGTSRASKFAAMAKGVFTHRSHAMGPNCDVEGCHEFWYGVKAGNHPSVLMEESTIGNEAL